MATAKEKSELDYMTARMGHATVSGDDSPAAAGTSSSVGDPPAASTESTSNFDDSITAEDALALKKKGNDVYKAGDYNAAVEKYSEAAKSPHIDDETRAIVLSNRAAAHLKLQRFQQTADDTTKALELKPGYVKALKRRKEARIALKQYRGASEDAKELKEPRVEIMRLERMADEQAKKDSEEAIESLKGIGNSILGAFGMSLDDLQMEKDPNTGSYSVNFSKGDS